MGVLVFLSDYASESKALFKNVCVAMKYSALFQSYQRVRSQWSAGPEMEPKAAGGGSCRQREQVVPGRASDSKPRGKAACPRFLGQPPVPVA